MRNETFLDRLFTREEEQRVIELYINGLTPKEIQANMLISLDFIEETIEAQKFSERCEKEKRETYENGLL